jgi:hypothetical protein
MASTPSWSYPYQDTPEWANLNEEIMCFQHRVSILARGTTAAGRAPEASGNLIFRYQIYPGKIEGDWKFMVKHSKLKRK